MEDILIVDDDRPILRLMDRVLSHHGYTVKTADNGIEAISLFDQNRHFNLVITDIRMPEADGNQVAKYVRDNVEIKNTPIIAMSANPDEAEKELFDLILEKPFSFKELDSVVKTLYRKTLGATGQVSIT